MKKAGILFWKPLQNPFFQSICHNTRKLLLLIPTVLLLYACAASETRPAVDASAYLFELEVSIGSQQAGFDPSVAKGAVSGMLLGAGTGAAGCILVGGTYGGEVGLILGVIISPACALVGGVAGVTDAEKKKDVEARITKLNEMAQKLNYPSDLPHLLSDDLMSGQVYQIAQAHETKDLATDVSAKPDEINIRPTLPNARIQINITEYGITGFGVDPALPLEIQAVLCVTEKHTDEALVYQKLTVESKPKKIEEWVAMGEEGLKTETELLIRSLSDRIQAAMSHQAPLDYRTSCN